MLVYNKDFLELYLEGNKVSRVVTNSKGSLMLKNVSKNDSYEIANRTGITGSNIIFILCDCNRLQWYENKKRLANIKISKIC